ncbi:glycosyltransferase family 4 protein [Qipengyuania marisflavi]|uniref:Glycosyltransferase family 4 protein n=1 Tax=Qipengyuania marisflavi TaxID=2486356 RepID=A0A5S3P1M2_9SPHN|nr:glycosyltransferase family 4 protein [Qipengyuania marisflavi]TMM46737.1 glycosyltransferase family 4 protein [Qipengyuania marisflavi]
MSVKNILFASDFANINGGQAKVAIEGARLLADVGKKILFFAASGEPDPLLDHPNIDVEILGHADILAEPSRIKAVTRGIWNGAAQRRLAELAAKFDPGTSLLHCHGYAKALSPAIGPVLTDGPLRAVYTMHEYFLACPNGGFYDYQRNEICHRRALGPACLTTNCDVRKPSHKAWRVARQAATWSAGRIPRKLSDVIYISETQRRAMAPYLSPATRLHHVPNPVNVDGLSTVDAASNSVFLFVGRLNPEKGGLAFARAARAAGAEAVFVGDGAEADAIRVANPEATITGWQTPQQVNSWLDKARALVFPSLWYEGQPLVPMEAICRGVPVVTNSWNAGAEFVEDGVSGTIYHDQAPAALEAALAKVRQLDNFDPQPYRELVSPEKHRDRLIALYANLLGDK